MSRIDEAFNSFNKPLLDAIAQSASDKKKLVQQINAENAQIEAESSENCLFRRKSRNIYKNGRT